VISDGAWAFLAQHLPDRSPRRGGRWRDHREVLEAIVWRYRNGAPWRELPERFGPWQTVYDRHVRWSRDGTYDRLLAAAHTAADAAGELDWLVAADSSVMRVHQHGATARRTTGNAATAPALEPAPAPVEEPTDTPAGPGGDSAGTAAAGAERDGDRPRVHTGGEPGILR